MDLEDGAGLITLPNQLWVTGWLKHIHQTKAQGEIHLEKKKKKKITTGQDDFYTRDPSSLGSSSGVWLPHDWLNHFRNRRGSWERCGVVLLD